MALLGSRACSRGVLSDYVSADLYGAPQPLIGIEASGTSWRLIQDRRNKYGWVSEGDESALSDVLSFNLTLGSSPRIMVDYMYSYEKVGKIRLTLEQDGATSLTRPKRRLENRGSFSSSLLPTTSVIIDAFRPESRFALETRTELFPKGFNPGWAMLHVSSVRLTTSEVVERNGVSKFKITAVRSC
jgi:hypothetical protein